MIPKDKSKAKAELVSSLEGIKPRTPLSKLISHLEFKKRNLTKLMKENGFKDFWEEVEEKFVGEFGQSCSGCRQEVDYMTNVEEEERLTALINSLVVN